MGYITRPGTEIRDFWPDDDINTIYIAGETSLASIIDRVSASWGVGSLDDIEISSEYIHTSCTTYPHYDPSDYTNFIVIRRKA